MNVQEAFHHIMSRPQTENGPPLRVVMVLNGYTPNNRNQTKGMHWSKLSKEKKRSGMALRDALKSLSSSTPPDLATTTDGILKAYKIGAWLLDSYRGMDGKLYLAGAYPEKQKRAKNAPKSKSP